MKEKTLVSISIVLLCIQPSSLANETSDTTKSDVSTASFKEQLDADSVNKWYYEGCLTGCSHGFMTGFSLGQIKKRKAAYNPSGAWPVGTYTSSIQKDLDDILSNEPRPYRQNEHPEVPPRVISTSEQLPIRHAGIYSTFYAAVHDGFVAAYSSEQKQDLVKETNKYLERYAASHASGLPPSVADKLLQQEHVDWVE
jgi:hypothetical protein